jgi:hypothetical protein
MSQRRWPIHPPSESSAQFIRDYLKKHGASERSEMWNAWCEAIQKDPTLAGRKFRGPKLSSFNHYLRTLARLDLIREVPAPKGKLGRWYELNHTQVRNEEAWKNPSAALDLKLGRLAKLPDGKLKPKSQLGRRRYSRYVLGMPPRKAGRPKKRGF